MLCSKTSLKFHPNYSASSKLCNFPYRKSAIYCEKRKGVDSLALNKLKETSMLKSISEVAPELLNFIETLELILSIPQKQHVVQVTPALRTPERSKSLSAPCRSIFVDLC
jgi:hypothetical protein